MKILIIAYYYPPISTGGTLRPAQWGKYLSQLGHEVTILTHSYEKDRTEPGNPRVLRYLDPSYNKARTTLRKKGQWLVLRLITEALNILGIYHSIYTWWKRKVIKHGEEIMGQERPDVIIATYPPVETLEIGIHFSQKYRIPLITDFRDGLLYEPIEIKRMSRYRCIREKYKTIEIRTAAQSAAIVTIAQPITGYFRQTYNHPQVSDIPNAFDPEDIKDLPADIPFNPADFNIVHTGRFSLSDNRRRPGCFFEAVRRVIEGEGGLGQRIKIHLVGEYRDQELAEIKDLIEKGVVVLHGMVERKRALAMQGKADLLLILSSLNRGSDTTIKLFEYLMAGKPILALTYRNVLEEIIEETKTGWSVHPQETEAIAELLGKIVGDREFYGTIKPDREKVEQYSIKAQVEKLNRLLKKIIGTLLPGEE